jgi:arylsulfatase A-like enzyme
VNGVDFMPTFAEIAAAKLPVEQPVDGKSILPLLKGDSFNADQSMFFHFPLYIGSGGEDKILPSYTGKENYWRAVPLTVVIKGDWKLIYYYEYERFELYNLKDDISESLDLSSSNSAKANELLDELEVWVGEVNAPIPQVENFQ